MRESPPTSVHPHTHSLALSPSLFSGFLFVSPVVVIAEEGYGREKSPRETAPANALDGLQIVSAATLCCRRCRVEGLLALAQSHALRFVVVVLLEEAPHPRRRVCRPFASPAAPAGGSVLGC